MKVFKDLAFEPHGLSKGADKLPLFKVDEFTRRTKDRRKHPATRAQNRVRKNRRRISSKMRAHNNRK